MNYSCVALLLAAACGSEKAACPGESSDNIGCTADICDEATNQWVHVPDNGACGSGQVCTLTGCADSALTGMANLFGHDAADPMHDHSGITVTLLQAGATGSAAGSGSASTVTTAADGSWSIGVEPGTYAVQYAKDGYFSVTSPGVVVGTGGGGVAPTVTLSRSERFGGSNQTPYLYTTGYTPSHTAFVETTYSGFDLVAYVTPLDGSHGTVTIAVPTTSPVIGDDSLLWSSDNNIWSVPLDGSSQPCIVGTAIGNGGSPGSISIVGTPKTYVVLEKTDPTTGLASLWTARTDCSVPPPTTAAWTQRDTSHPLATEEEYLLCSGSPPSIALSNDDQTVLFFTNNSTASYPTDGVPGAHRIDLATNTEADVSFTTAFPFEDFLEYSISPDGEHIYGVPFNGEGPTFDVDYRGFVADVTSTSLNAPIPIAAVNAGATEENYSDLAYGPGSWAPDSSGIAYASYSDHGAFPGGGLKFWKAGATSSMTITADGTYPGDLDCYSGVNFYGNHLLGFPSAASGATYNGSNYSVASLDGAGAVQVIDSSALATVGNSFIDPTTGATTGPAGYVDPSSGAVYLVWAEPTAVGGATPNLVKSAAITPSPLSANVVTLGSAIAPTCAFSGALSDNYFYELCSNTGTVTAFPPSTPTASGTFTGALAPLYPISGGNAIAFVEPDNRVWGATNASTFGSDSVHVIASTVDSTATSEMSMVGKWLVYFDATANVTRASNVTAGGVIDEAISTCDALSYSAPTMDNAGSNLWFPTAYCYDNQNSDYRTYMTPTANLP